MLIFILIFSALNEMVKAVLPSSSEQEEVFYLVLTYFENVGVTKEPEEVARLCSFLRESICYWVSVINDISHGDPSSLCLDESKLSLIWGAVTCYHHVFGTAGNASLIMDLIDALDRLLMFNAGKVICLLTLS